MPADAPSGLCPRCLLALNLETQSPSELATVQESRSANPPPAQPLSVEEVAKLFPQLEIIQCLGRGGMGVVYQARQPRLDRWVALKILTGNPDPLFAERFAREARALARLTHPNIVTVHDFGESGGHFYLLMEYMDGMNLRQLLQHGKISPAEALAIVPKICDALQYAHEQGVVHRDIKPENILLDKQGRVKIADFGIAKLVGHESTERTLTGDRQVIGTPHYMAPEQVEKPKTVDHRADIYSLGVVFYEMLTGELPLGRFAPPSGRVLVDVRLDEVVLRALEKDPVLRYQRAGDFKTQVETFSRLSAANAGVPPSPAPASGPGLSPDVAHADRPAAAPPPGGEPESRRNTGVSSPAPPPPKSGFLSYLLKPPPRNPAREAEWLRRVERDIVLPVKILALAYLAVCLYHPRNLGDFTGTQEVVLEVTRRFFLLYVGLQMAAGGLFLAFNRVGLAVLQRATFASGLLDSLMLAFLVLTTGGFDSVFYWVFIALIVRHSLSLPPGWFQLTLNFLVSGCYFLAGELQAAIARFEPPTGETPLTEAALNSEPAQQLFILILITLVGYLLQVIQEKQRLAHHAGTGN